jgi:hypothetical protein
MSGPHQGLSIGDKNSGGISKGADISPQPKQTNKQTNKLLHPRMHHHHPGAKVIHLSFPFIQSDQIIELIFQCYSEQQQNAKILNHKLA